MRKILVIGIGAGNPEHLTLQAVAAMNATDVFFVNDKGDEKAELVRLRGQMCERFITNRSYRTTALADPVRDPAIRDYAERVQHWHNARAEAYEQAILNELAENATGAFLVWGDPGLYDSTLRILELVLRRGHLAFDYEVIPGITSIQALAARHKVPLNEIGEPITITTGRRLAEADQLPEGTLAIMLDAGCSFRHLDPVQWQVHWGAYVGMPDERLISGPLEQVANEIERTREQARREHGWIMDAYLLRRTR